MTAAPAFDERFAAALRLANEGQVEAAARTFASLARDAPQHAPSRQMLGVLLMQLGRSAEALAEFDAAIALSPQTVQIACLRSEVLLAVGRGDEAIGAACDALKLDPGSVAAAFRLGLALLAMARWREATDTLTRVVSTQPTFLAAKRALVRSLLFDGDIQLAVAIASEAALLDSPDMVRAIAADFVVAGATDARIEWLRALLARHPHDYDATLMLAAALHLCGRPSAALEYCERALELRPDENTPREIRAAALIDRGDIERGLAIYRDLLPTAGDETAARYLVVMHYDPGQDNAGLFAAHADFAQRHLPRFGMPFGRRAHDPEKKLRVGWLSPRFGESPVARFLGGLLASFDRERHRHLLIALQPVRDAVGTELLAFANESIDASGLDDETLLLRLRALDLDVLIDLAGHATANRLRVVAQRVAPLQICWLDWFDTTAVPAMDAWISDRWLTPPQSSQRYSETLVRLASGRFCYTPPAAAPDAHHGGDRSIVVFGSFNRLAKFNDGVIDTWSEILRRVPHAQLELRSRMLDDAHTRDHLFARFAARGISASRLRLHGELPYRDLLAAYRCIDIALDPFPFSGCTTTCDALWMGCPVLSWPGETFVSRQSASLLWRLGRPEWVAESRDDYVERAIALAQDTDVLRAQRNPLRDSVRTHLCAAHAQAADFAGALRALWQERCSSSA